MTADFYPFDMSFLGATAAPIANTHARVTIDAATRFRIEPVYRLTTRCGTGAWRRTRRATAGTRHARRRQQCAQALRPLHALRDDKRRWCVNQFAARFSRASSADRSDEPHTQ